MFGDAFAFASAKVLVASYTFASAFAVKNAVCRNAGSASFFKTLFEEAVVAACTAVVFAASAVCTFVRAENIFTSVNYSSSKAFEAVALYVDNNAENCKALCKYDLRCLCPCTVAESGNSYCFAAKSSVNN